MTVSSDNSILLPATGYDLTEADIARFAAEQQRGMISPTDPLLQQSMPAVDPDAITGNAIKQVIARLQEAAKGQRGEKVPAGNKRTLVGLAAPQIGERYRIVLVDTSVEESRKRYGKLECFINPEIIWRTRETAEVREGCFSAGPVWGLVRRPVAVKIRAFTPDGIQVERILEGFTARVACHEIDHLDGMRFPDRITSDRKRHWVHTEELQIYPEHIINWPRLCTLARWHAYRDGHPL